MARDVGLGPVSEGPNAEVGSWVTSGTAGGRKPEGRAVMMLTRETERRQRNICFMDGSDAMSDNKG